MQIDSSNCSQQKKLKNLESSQTSVSSFPEKSIKSTVLNLSSVSSTDSEKGLLVLGFSMCFPPSKIRYDEQKAEAESLVSRLKAQDGEPINNDIIAKIRNAFKSYFSKHRVSKGWKSKLNAIRRLAKNNDIVVSKFDKGNGILIQDKKIYIEKLQEVLSDTSRFKTYKVHKRSKKNPFILEEDRFNRKLQDLKAKKLINDDIFKSIRACGSQPVRLYGLPKVHKCTSNPPYRPIMSMRNSYTSKLALWLDDLLKKYVPRKFSLKDTFQFVEDIKSLSLPEEKQFDLFSLDVKSLFTNIPVNRTINHITSLIDFGDFPISEKALKSLLNLSCTNILFSFLFTA